MMENLPQEVLRLARAVNQSGGKAILVGGSVRDHFLANAIPKDLDIEIYQMSLEKLEALLTTFGKVHAVGKSFGVLKLTTSTAEYDISFPRRESKTGKGHKGFLVEPDPEMTFEEAASRRDFTINAMGWDILQNTLSDPFGGMQDIDNKILRHVGPSFVEDPLRVMRAMQFAGRFEFTIAPETMQLCHELDLSELPKERLYEEFKKLLLKANRPSIGLEAARKLGILHYFPELEALIGVPQDPVWHPEGDVWVHNCMVVDQAALLREGDDHEDLCVMFGALCHDFGKALTTEMKEGRWRSIGHCEAGMEPTEQFLRRLTDENNLIETVKILVKEHLRPSFLYDEREHIKDGAIRRLSVRIPIPLLLKVCQADHFGRTTPDAIARDFPAGRWLTQKAEELHVKDNQPQPLLMGRHLLTLKMPPGPKMGKLLNEAFELQLDGKLTNLEEATEWAKQHLSACSKN